MTSPSHLRTARRGGGGSSCEPFDGAGGLSRGQDSDRFRIGGGDSIFVGVRIGEGCVNGVRGCVAGVRGDANSVGGAGNMSSSDWFVLFLLDTDIWTKTPRIVADDLVGMLILASNIRMAVLTVVHGSIGTQRMVG